MEFVGSAMNELHIAEDGGSGGGRMGRRRYRNDQMTGYKSKNLEAERRRRRKLSGRLLTLRALVPIITNMNKATIIDDAITYIEELQMTVETLSNQLLEMEASSSEEGPKPRCDDSAAAEEEIECEIEEDVQVTYINGNKFWIKIILVRRRGRFTRLIEAMSLLGFELTDTSVTTSKGAMLVSSSIEGTFDYKLTVQQTSESLLKIIRNI